jgi:hypothetical protein
MVEVNPFSLLQLGNPAPRPPGPDPAQELQTKALIQGLSDAAAGKRQDTVNLTNLRTTGMPLYLDPRPAHDTEFRNRMKTGFGTDQFSKGAAAIGNIGGSGVGFDLSTLDTPTVSNVDQATLIPQMFKGASQAAIEGETAAQKLARVVTNIAVDPSGKQVGTLGTQTTTKEDKLTGKVKSVSPDQAQAVINSVMNQFPDLQGDPSQVVDMGDVYHIVIDGRKFEVPK